MSRLRADTMPAVTDAAEAERVADRDHPFAEPDLVGVAELHRLERLGRLDAQHREIGLLVAADDLGLEPRAVGEDDGDLVGFGDDVVVGDDDAGRIDDEAGAERVDAARRAIGRLVVAALAAAVLEELLEELLERRARRQVAAPAAPPPLPPPRAFDLLRGRDVDHRVDHFFGNVGDVFRAARRDVGVESAGSAMRRGRNRGQSRLPEGMREGGEQAGHGRQIS